MKPVLGGLGLLLFPRIAHACSVCFSATEQNRMAFLVTTIVLSLLPLGIIAGGLLWLRRQAQRLSGEQGATSEESVPLARMPERA